VGSVLPPAPLDLVDLLLDLKRLEIIELGLVRLELGVELVLAGLFLPGASAKAACGRKGGEGLGVGSELTVSLRSNRTTRPPLSPVAR
jgi:hypothetical protein